MEALKSSQKHLRKINEIIELLSRNPDLTLEHKYYELVKESEKFTEIVRLLPSYFGDYNYREKVIDTILESEIVPTTISQSDNMLHIHFKSLLPRKEKDRAGYVRTSLFIACEKFVKENEVSVIEKPSIIIFKHNYADDKRAWRDHDNIEVNVLIDVVANFFLKDDSAKLLDHLHFSRKADEDSTDIYIIPREDLVKWLAENY